eukprot:211868_1
MSTLILYLHIIIATSYYISPNQLDWHQAEDFCIQHCGSHLASIHDSAQNNELISLIQSAVSDIMLNIPSTMDTYIGLHDTNGNGNWAWSDGSSFDYGNDIWMTNNPNYIGAPICVQMEGSDNSYQWNDVKCNDTTTPVIFACNSCDSVITKYAMDDTRHNRGHNAEFCNTRFGTELMSFHSQADWDEGVRLCRLINEQSSLTLGYNGADMEDDCHVGLYRISDTVLIFEDGTSWDWATNLNAYPWNNVPDTSLDYFRITRAYALGATGSGSLQWALCNMPSETCYASRWSVIISTSWSFTQCQITSSYASNALIMLEAKRWNNHGQNIAFEMMFTMNEINPSQSSDDPSTAGIVWHVDNTCSHYYYIGINDFDDSVFFATVKNDVMKVIHSQSLPFTYWTATYYALKATVTTSNTFNIYVNNALILSNVVGSIDEVDATNGYIGIKNTRSSIIVKSLFVSGDVISEPTNDAVHWFGPCDTTTLQPTNPSVNPTESPSFVPTKRPTNAPIIPGSPTKSPVLPEAIVCGERLIGPYDNAPISFEVVMPYEGYLEFDASLSDPLTISQLSVVFAVTSVASDADHDGIIAFEDTAPGTYTFTIVAHNGVNQMYDVQTSCHGIHTTVSNRIASTVAVKTAASDDNMFGIPENQLKFAFILIGLAVLCLICAVALSCLIKYQHKKKNTEETDVDIASGDVIIGNVMKVQPVVSDVDDIGVMLVKSWVSETVGLPQHVDRFIQNGFDSFKTIKRIHNEQELMEIGITKRGHVKVIMAEIRALQNPEGEQGHARIQSRYTVEGGTMSMEMATRPSITQSNQYEDMYGSFGTPKENKTITGGNTTRGKGGTDGNTLNGQGTQQGVAQTHKI